MKSGIYKILNKITMQFYIGSAIDLASRWRQHKYLLKCNKHNNTHLQRAWNKYGEESFEFIIIELCEKEKLLEFKQSWINWTQVCKNGYNQRTLAHSNIGVKWTEEHKAKISATKSGVKQSPEAIKNRADANRGKKRSQETKNKISQKNKGRKFTEETKLKMSKAKLNKNSLFLTGKPIEF